MNYLSTTDNNLGKNLKSLGCTYETAREVYADLSKIANISLQDLCAKNPALLVFPKVLGENKDDIDKLPIFTMAGSGEGEAELSKVKLTTGNIMGFIGCGETQLEITSRFAPNEPTRQKEDFFLHYLLQKVFSLNLFALKHFSSKGMFDFLTFMFPHFLKAALSQGIFKTYQHLQKNDANIKGAVNISRHIKENIPFRGRISYNTRECTCDNDMTELIRHTIEAIKTKGIGKTILYGNDETRHNIELITSVTPSYSSYKREQIISKNAKLVSHPYFTKYRTLQKICLAILKHQKLKYGSNSKQIYGILFDGAWLWEEYLATILVKCNFKHPRNKVGSGGISLWSGRPCYPDFYKGEQIKNFNYGEAIPQENFVLDAKYKRLSDSLIDRDDVHQLITYMHILPANKAELIYPIPAQEYTSDTLAQGKEHAVHGLGGTIKTLGFPIPQTATSYDDFCNMMQRFETQLCSHFISM